MTTFPPLAQTEIKIRYFPWANRKLGTSMYSNRDAHMTQEFLITKSKLTVNNLNNGLIANLNMDKNSVAAKLKNMTTAEKFRKHFNIRKYYIQTKGNFPSNKNDKICKP